MMCCGEFVAVVTVCVHKPEAQAKEPGCFSGLAMHYQMRANISDTRSGAAGRALRQMVVGESIQSGTAG
jgi:hypothetical protein